MVPKFKHDCYPGGCVYLGQHHGEDLYIHVRGPKTIELIHRWSDDGPDYGCMLYPYSNLGVYAEIAQRAIEAGLIPGVTRV